MEDIVLGAIGGLGWGCLVGGLVGFIFLSVRGSR